MAETVSNRRNQINWKLILVFAIAAISTGIILLRPRQEPSEVDDLRTLVESCDYILANPLDNERWRPGTIFKNVDNVIQPYSTLTISTKLTKGTVSDYKKTANSKVSTSLSASPVKDLSGILKAKGITRVSLELRGLHTEYYPWKMIKDTLVGDENLRNDIQDRSLFIIMDVMVANEILITVKDARSSDLEAELKKNGLDTKYESTTLGELKSKGPMIIGIRPYSLTVVLEPEDKPVQRSVPNASGSLFVLGDQNIIPLSNDNILLSSKTNGLEYEYVNYSLPNSYIPLRNAQPVNNGQRLTVTSSRFDKLTVNSNFDSAFLCSVPMSNATQWKVPIDTEVSQVTRSSSGVGFDLRPYKTAIGATRPSKEQWEQFRRLTLSR